MFLAPVKNQLAQSWVRPPGLNRRFGAPGGRRPRPDRCAERADGGLERLALGRQRRFKVHPLSAFVRAGGQTKASRRALPSSSRRVVGWSIADHIRSPPQTGSTSPTSPSRSRWRRRPQGAAQDGRSLKPTHRVSSRLRERTSSSTSRLRHGARRLVKPVSHEQVLSNPTLLPHLRRLHIIALWTVVWGRNPADREGDRNEPRRETA